MRNAWRVAAFDIAAPVAAVAALTAIGVALRWPIWWVAVFTALGVLLVQGVVVNAVLARRDGVTVGTDDDGPGVRLAVVAVTVAALVAAVAVGYTRWTVPDRALDADTAEVVRIGAAFAENYASFSPQAPTASVNRAADMMAEQQAELLRRNFVATATQLTARNLTAQAATVSAGVEAIGPAQAAVAVFLSVTQTVPDAPPQTSGLALRVALSDDGGGWRVVDAAPIDAVAPTPSG